MMKKELRLLSVLIVLMMAFFMSACSGGDDNDEKKPGGGGVTPDPNIPVLSNITYELNPTATIVAEATTKQLVSVDTTGHKLTLPASADKPEVGQTLIFNTPTKELPYGLLAKVKSVTETSKGYQISYDDAELKDAFKDIDIPEQYIPLGDYVEHVYDADGNEVSFQKTSASRAHGVKSFPLILPEIAWKLGSGIEFTPKMTIDLLMRYVFQFGDYELSICRVNIDADITVGADLSMELDASKLLNKKFHVLTVVLGAIPIGPVLLTPSIDIQGIVSIEGKISLEASITYKRSLHAVVKYTKGYGLEGDAYLDPEEPDALEFSFGPKFEGGISYGFALGGNIGVFHKTLAVRSRINMVKKETISGKFNILSFKGTGKEWLTPFQLDLVPTQEGSDKYTLNMLDWALKWKVNEFADVMYNQAVGIKVGWDLTTLGLDVASTDLPEMSIPISSTPICPQVKIDEKDFMSFKDNDVTLKLHHTGKSILDDLTEFRAVFKRVGAKDDEKPIVKYFDFDAEKRNLLVAEIKNLDVNSTAKVTLNGTDSYDFTVYMNVLDTDIPIFEGKAKSNSEVAAIIINGSLVGTSPDYENGARHEQSFFYIGADMLGNIKTTADGKKLHIQGFKTHEDDDDNIVVESGTAVSFDIDDVSAIDNGKAKIKNLFVDTKFGFISGDNLMFEEYFVFTVGADLPMAPESEVKDAVKIAESLGATKAKAWKLTQADGLKFKQLSFTRKDWVYKWDKEARKDVLDHIDQSTFTLQNDADNSVRVIILFK